MYDIRILSLILLEKMFLKSVIFFKNGKYYIVKIFIFGELLIFKKWNVWVGNFS